MAKKSEEQLMEAETTIRWDETDAPAALFTCSIKTRNEWRAYGFKIRESRIGTQVYGWYADVPKDRITYKMFRTAK